MTKEERAIEAINALNREQHMLEFGYKGISMEFNIRGRKFVVREVAQ